MVGVPVGPGEEDVEDLCRDLLQLVRINSFPDRRYPGNTKSPSSESPSTNEFDGTGNITFKWLFKCSKLHFLVLMVDIPVVVSPLRKDPGPGQAEEEEDHIGE